MSWKHDLYVSAKKQMSSVNRIRVRSQQYLKEPGRGSTLVYDVFNGETGEFLYTAGPISSVNNEKFFLVEMRRIPIMNKEEHKRISKVLGHQVSRPKTMEIYWY